MAEKTNENNKDSQMGQVTTKKYFKKHIYYPKCNKAQCVFTLDYLLPVSS